MSHPVGTGPYRLKSWRRNSRIVLEKNPLYRDGPLSQRACVRRRRGQAWAKRLNGRRLPLNDGVEISIVEENQPRWLSFLLGQADFARVPPELSIIAAPNGKIAPNLARQGIRLQRYVNSDITLSYFNMEDPVVGGNTPTGSRCGARSRSHTTSTRRSASSGAAGDRRAGADPAQLLRLRPDLSDRQQSL
jgi:ABC-type oligopeptide transport system substrate-binding subunit